MDVEAPIAPALMKSLISESSHRSERRDVAFEMLYLDLKEHSVSKYNFLNIFEKTCNELLRYFG